MNEPVLPIIPEKCIPKPSGLADIRSMIYKGPRLNKADLRVKLPPIKISRDKGGLHAVKEILPENFSWRNVKNVNIETPRDQGGCGSCWAFSSATVLGDRYSIKFGEDGNVRGGKLSEENETLPVSLVESTIKGMKSPLPSVLWVLSCATPYADGITAGTECNSGGSTSDAVDFFATTGNKLESCWPYKLVENNPVGKWVSYPCLQGLPKTSCYDCNNHPDSSSLFRVIPDSAVQLYITKEYSDEIDIPASILLIKKEIYNKGPVITSFNVYQSFMDFWKSDYSKKSVYIPVMDKIIGGHAVCLTGWGTSSDGIRYWEVRNSWGSLDADNGFCKMACSDQVREQDRNGIDIPILSPEGYKIGGALSFDIPDTLHDYKPSPFLSLENKLKVNPVFNFLIKHKEKIINILLILIVVMFLLKIIRK